MNYVKEEKDKLHILAELLSEPSDLSSAVIKSTVVTEQLAIAEAFMKERDVNVFDKPLDQTHITGRICFGVASTINARRVDTSASKAIANYLHMKLYNIDYHWDINDTMKVPSVCDMLLQTQYRLECRFKSCLQLSLYQ